MTTIVAHTLPCAKHCFKHVNIYEFIISSQEPYEVDTIITPILKMGKLRYLRQSSPRPGT